MKPHLSVGHVAIVDEIGVVEHLICDLGCPHDVYPITRRALTITTAVFKSPWPNVPPEHRHAYPPGYSSYEAVDPEGAVWTWNALGDGYVWEAGDRRASNVSLNGRISQGTAAVATEVFIFTNLTDVEPPVPGQ